MRLSPDAVKAIRADLKLTQPELAEKLGAHIRTIRRWETQPGGASRLGSRALLRLVEQKEEDGT